MPIRLLIAVSAPLMLISGAQAQNAAGRLAADTSLSAGAASLTGTRDWVARKTNGLLVLEAPEGDARLAVVEIGAGTGAATTAAEATAAAWARYQPVVKRPSGLLSSLPLSNGWQEHKVTEYDTPANDAVGLEAHALRNGATWTVLLIEGNRQTLEQRRAAVALAMQSLKPKDAARESFAGRKALPLDAARLQQIRTFLLDAMKTLNIPGLSYALLDRGNIVMEGGLGVREAGRPEPVDAHTLFMAASNTDSLSTLMLATLVDEGRLKWDQPVTQLYPSFKLGTPDTSAGVQVKHLVCACVGLPRQNLEWVFEYRHTTPETVLKLLASNSPTSGFGQVFQYNDLMASAAGYIGGHLDYPDSPLGPAYDQAMQQRVLTPLGMSATTFDMERALRSNHASPHGMGIGGEVELIPMAFNYAIVPYRPAGGAWTSAHDLIRYVQLEANLGKLRNGMRIVSSEALLARRLPQVAAGEGKSYGMGLITETAWGVPVVYHGGSLFGFKSNFYLLPEAGIGAVLLTNSEQGQLLLRPMLRRLLEIVYDGKPEAADAVVQAAARGDDKRNKAWHSITMPVAPDLAAKLARRYRSTELGELTVIRKGKQVIFDFGEWTSAVGSRKNEDGSHSLMAIDAALGGLEFLIGNKSGKRRLSVRDGEHEYVFSEI